jgi:hypothetical protein
MLLGGKKVGKQKETGILKKTSAVLGVITLLIIVYIVLTKNPFSYMTNKHTILRESRDILQLDISSDTYIGVNNKQIIKVTKDGIVAYDLNGEELWSDTLTLDDYIVRQREPYIAVANKMGNSITIFNEKGKQGEVISENPVAYFSVNKNGSIAVIESLGESHVVSAYDKTGNSLGVKRITYTKDAGYPAVAELSPNDEILLASYLNVDKPVLTSTLTALKTQKPKEEIKDDSVYGIEQKDNLIYEIEFVKDNEWVSVGDKTTTWYTLSGSEISNKRNLFFQFNPYLVKMSHYGEGFFPAVSATTVNGNMIHRENTLSYFNAKGEEYFSLKLDETATYFYSDDKGVIIGQKKHFMGYNKIGTKLFEFTTALDVTKVLYLEERRNAIAVTKDKVILLEPKKEGE